MRILSLLLLSTVALVGCSPVSGPVDAYIDGSRCQEDDYCIGAGGCRGQLTCYYGSCYTDAGMVVSCEGGVIGDCVCGGGSTDLGLVWCPWDGGYELCPDAGASDASSDATVSD